jgi:hypothetical protein
LFRPVNRAGELRYCHTIGSIRRNYQKKKKKTRGEEREEGGGRREKLGRRKVEERVK